MATDDACGDDGDPRLDPEILGVGDDWAEASDPDVSQLVEFNDEKFGLTGRQDLDIHSAITSGLANYLLTLDGAIAGRSCMLRSVTADWAEHSTGGLPLPTAAVNITEEVDFPTSSGLGVGHPIDVGQDPSGNQITLVRTALFETESLMVGVQCADKEQRRGVRRMLELGLWPVTWMAGFRLVLPRYHNALATFLLLAAGFPDGEESAQRSLWPIRLRLRVSCQGYRPHLLPLARPIVSGTIS